MAIILDSFMSDLNELSNDETNVVVEEISENNNNVDNVWKLQNSRRCNHIMQRIEDEKQKSCENLDHDQLIVDCNALLVDIDNEITIVHNFIRDNYRLKFPELESIVRYPIDYARVVKKIGNEMDMSLVHDLHEILSPALVMVVSISGSCTNGNILVKDVLRKTIEACECAIELDSTREKILDFVETRMVNIAPNLSAIVGSAVAAKLIGTAGGLPALANRAACDIMSFGAEANKEILTGFSRQFRGVGGGGGGGGGGGYIEETKIVQSTPPRWRKQACRVVAAKSMLVARMDSIAGDKTGETGRKIYQEIYKKIEKWQELPHPRMSKPLPVPDLRPKNKRGGRRLRKAKERYSITKTDKLANRMAFGVA
ncbi:U4/U6 small nuclear ribonucleoprotein Prp31 homolog [Beta vulgaris subsp. vulgaris]|uniref:U4/U6 small nuclear ribonucleoprotein Prp31 homolog n=1 Tax=Beta vulgaris subsp. vulgaris TaxID=3555 RepID=UPI0020375169|nr:U4/U6 small nuclear ribonucleoprotein Prp31 homolog [Beta vulgaris subsp. vulgaris]